MRNISLLIVYTILLFSQISSAVDYKELKQAQEIKVVLDTAKQYFHAFSLTEQNPTAILETICDDDIIAIFADGRTFNGKQQLIEVYKKEISNLKEAVSDFSMKYEEQSVDIIADTAEVMEKVIMTGSLKDGSLFNREAMATLKLKKQNGRWFIVREQSTLLKKEIISASQQSNNSLRQPSPAAVIVDGKPLFVICARDAVIGEFAEYKRAGFNTVMTHNTHTPGLRQAQQYGLLAIDVFPDYLFDHNKKRFLPSYWENIKTQIEERKVHPALLAWSMPTDSIGFGVNPFEMKEICNLTANDGKRKYRLINFAGNVDSLNPYLEFVDIVFYEHWGMKKQTPAIAWKMDKLQEKNKVSWYMQHAVKGDRLPSQDQFRSHIFLAVNHGATGILIDGFEPLLWKEFVGDKQYVSLGDPELSNLRNEAMQVAHELEALAPAVLAGALTDKLCEQDNPEIDIKGYIEPGSDTLYIVAVNPKNKNVQQSFSVPETKRSSAIVSREDRKVQILENMFIDNFKPLQTHIYKLMVDPEPYSKVSITSPKAGNTQNSIVGIGVRFAVVEKGALIQQVLGNPAGQAGLEPGFTITSVDGTSIAGKNESEIVNMIKGPIGTTVSLEVLTYDGTKTFRITRDIIPLKR